MSSAVSLLAKRQLDLKVRLKTGKPHKMLLICFAITWTNADCSPVLWHLSTARSDFPFFVWVMFREILQHHSDVLVSMTELQLWESTLHHSAITVTNAASVPNTVAHTLRLDLKHSFCKYFLFLLMRKYHYPNELFHHEIGIDYFVSCKTAQTDTVCVSFCSTARWRPV